MKYSLIFTLLTISIGLVSPVQASSEKTFQPYLLAWAGQSLDSAVQSVKEKTGGRILSTKTVNANGKRVHKIKVLLPSGQVQVFHIDAN